MSLSCLLLAPLVLAQAPEPPIGVEDRPSEDFQLEITTTAWFPRLLGTYSIGPDGTSLDVETDTYLHDSEVVFMGQMDVRFDVWTIRVIGEEFSTSGSGVLRDAARVAGMNLPAGSSWQSDYSQWSVGTELEVAIWRPFADEPFPWSSGAVRSDNRDIDGDYLVDLRISGRAGVRFQHVRQDFDSSSVGLSVSERAGWSAIVLGMMVEVGIDTRPVLPILEEIAIKSGVTVSPIVGGGSGWMYSVEASIRGYVTPSAALTFGFRLQGTNATSDQYQRNGSIMGLVAGASFKF